MKIPKVIHALALFSIAACPLAAADSLQCYSYPVGGMPSGKLGESLESDYQMRFNYAQKQGADMQKWQDTAKFVFMVVFHSVGSGEVIPDPKDGNKPDPKPVDTLSPRAFEAWAHVLFTQHIIYDYNDPQRRLSAPTEPSDTFRPLLGTRATMLQISNECFTRAIDAGAPGRPINLRRKVQRIVVSGKENTGAAFNIAGQKSTTNILPSSSVLFKK